MGQLAALQVRQQHQRLECQRWDVSLRLGPGHMQHGGPRHRDVSTHHPRAKTLSQGQRSCLSLLTDSRQHMLHAAACPGAAGTSACAPASLFKSRYSAATAAAGHAASISFCCVCATRSCSCWRSSQRARAAGSAVLCPDCCANGIDSLICSDLDCEPCPRQLEGTLPDVLGQLTALRLLTLCGNSLRGTLPAAWGVDGAFTELKVGV